MSGGTRALVIAILLLSAGCLGVAGPEEDDGPKPAQDPNLEASPASQEGTISQASDEAPEQAGLFNGTAKALGNLTTDDWFVLETEATPEAGLTAVRWQVPPGSQVPWEPFEDVETVAIEIVPVVSDDADLEAWSLMAFQEKDGELRPLLTATETTFEGHNRLVALDTPIEHDVDADPLIAYLGFDQVSEGETLHLVLAAKATETTPFGAAFRVLPEDPYPDFETVSGLEELREEMDGQPPAALPVDGQGTGLQVAAYVDVTSLYAFQSVYKTAAMQVEEGLPDEPVTAGSVRQTSLSTGFDTDEGWTTSSAVYLGSLGAGTWSASADAHDVAISGRSVNVEARLAPTALAFGVPVYYLSAGGPGGSGASFEVTMANANELEALVMSQQDLGTSLATLTGIPANDTGAVFTGIAGDVPPTALLDGGEHLHVLSPLIGVTTMPVPDGARGGR